MPFIPSKHTQSYNASKCNTFSITHHITHTQLTLGFSVLTNDTVAHRIRETGIKPPTFWLVDDLLIRPNSWSTFLDFLWRFWLHLSAPSQTEGVCSDVSKSEEASQITFDYIKTSFRFIAVEKCIHRYPQHIQFYLQKDTGEMLDNGAKHKWFFSLIFISDQLFPEFTMVNGFSFLLWEQ